MHLDTLGSRWEQGRIYLLANGVVVSHRRHEVSPVAASYEIGKLGRVSVESQARFCTYLSYEE